MENELENNDSKNVENENANSENSNETLEVEATEDVEALKEQNRQLFARAKKAEGFELKDGQWIKKPQPKIEAKPAAKEQPKGENYSLSDIRALNDVHDEDVADVVGYAKFKGITIAESKNTGVIKTLLAEKEEQRKIAEATNTKTTRRTVQKPSELDVYEKAERGEYPQDASELARARTAKLRANAKN